MLSQGRMLFGAVALLLSVGLLGCPLGDGDHHEHPELDGQWQRVNPQDAHSFEAEQIHFEEGENHEAGEVYYFGPFGGPNAMMESKDEEAPVYPAFQGVYEIDESVVPHTIDFTWTNYWPDEDEALDFESFTQKGIWEAMIDDHGEHNHEILYINFGNGESYPVDFLDETHGQEIKFENIGEHEHDENDQEHEDHHHEH